jgi:predicted acylesterase/phospholipase RssA
MPTQPISAATPEPNGFKLSHKSEPQSDGKEQWRVGLDVPPELLAQVAAVVYSPQGLPSRPGLEREQFSALMGSAEPMTIHAVIQLKGGQESKQISYTITTATAGNTTASSMNTPPTTSYTVAPVKPLDRAKLIEEARIVLAADYVSKLEPQAFRQRLAELAKYMEKLDQFDYATELLLKKHKLEKAAGQRPVLAEVQRLAKCIYKDTSLSSYLRFDLAIRELDETDPLRQSDSCETLGLAGAIYKRWWQYDHQHSHLELSRYYYRRGFDTWKKYADDGSDLYDEQNQHNDQGWNAINFAYILELDAVNNMEEIGGIAGVQPEDVRSLEEAQKTRKYILKQFVDETAGAPQLKNKECKKWVVATVAEAYFGLCRYEDARTFITMYRERGDVDPWELRTFGQQILSIAYLQETRQRILASMGDKDVMTSTGEASKAGINACLTALNINTQSAGATNNYGKVGLAFSGGGFRASLYHIGVLAALAERDELKNIEVISCVSGGSIIGAYYYLKLKFLLEEKKDEAIKREDYIALVKEIEKDFLAGVQKNLRMRVFSNLISNFKMLGKNYSRTNRLGELYEMHLYKPLVDKAFEKLSNSDSNKLNAILQKRLKDYGEISRGERHISMNDLFIVPEDGFVLGTDNWKREHKVPQLVLNATTLNTGHNWQFTAAWMGEPAFDILSDIDVKPRLRRMYYKDAPTKDYQNFRLGFAVGASSCVPVLFEPLPLNDLYENVELQLIDGGLHDNQGIAALIDQECKNIIISDASGQLPVNNTGVSGLLSLFVRADNIVQERVRELQFLDMKERKNTALVSRLNHVHLKKGLPTVTRKWIGCDDPDRTIYEKNSVAQGPITSYGVLKDAQEHIAGIRTDLDAFHNTEAWALMYDGYQQVHQALAVSSEPPVKKDKDWAFLNIGEYLTDKDKGGEVNKLLQLSGKVPFKVYEMLGGKKITIVLGLLLGAGLVYLTFQWLNAKPAELSISKWKIVTMVGLFVVGLLFKPAAILLDPKGFIQKKVIRVGVAILGFAICRTYIGCFNGVYLKRGKLKKD